MARRNRPAAPVDPAKAHKQMAIKAHAEHKKAAAACGDDPAGNAKAQAVAHEEPPTWVSVNLADVAGALAHGSLDNTVKPFLAAARRKLHTREFRRAGVSAEKAKPCKFGARPGTFNMRSVLDWIESLRADDKESCDQLCQLVALAQKREG